MESHDEKKEHVPSPLMPDRPDHSEQVKQSSDTPEKRRDFVLLLLLVFLSPIASAVIQWLQVTDSDTHPYSFSKALASNFSVAFALAGILRLPELMLTKVNSDLKLAIENSKWLSSQRNWWKKLIQSDSASSLVSYDSQIPYSERWYWIYIPLYYFVFLMLVLGFKRGDQVLNFIFHYGILTFLVTAIQYGSYHQRPKSSGLGSEGPKSSHQDLPLPDIILNFYQREKSFLAEEMFPSTRVTHSLLLSYYLFNQIGYLCLLFPLLIAISCLQTKKNKCIDVIGGTLIGGIYVLTLLI